MLDMDQIVSYFPAPLRAFKRNLLREYLQYKILEVIYDSPVGDNLVFMGGTAIHIIHGGPRFSEDLDFDNRGLDLPAFESLGRLVRSRMERQGFSVEAKVVQAGALRLSLRFPGLFRLMGLSRDPREKLHLQVDAEPQNFPYAPAVSLIDKFDVFGRVAAAPADILLAQKIFCLLARRRVMGRDFFDALFLWGKTEPSPDYLREKLGLGSGQELKARLLDLCRPLDFDRLSEDVAPFLYRPEDAKKIRMFPEFVESRTFEGIGREGD
ncbi:MAG: nucleotidyl transferase AbiEii/AbiGii toxin family protein [Candidatus Aminicenantes bacterium]|nr:nucleotidyl transferase AbiEii/AbiGii toxin family protein [Candidatus Aminicenantes bacterium]